MFDFFNTTEKLSHAMRKLIAPRKDFKEQTKMAFLAVFDAAHPESRYAHSVTGLAKTFIAGGALLSIFAGMSVYADTANVAADSTFYPLKRLSENVQLALTPSVQKPKLQATFAARRANEISDLAIRKPTSTIIAGLDKDLDSEVDNSISAAVATNLSDGKLNDFCGTMLSAIATSSVSNRGRLSVHLRALTRFEGECAATGTDAIAADAIGNASSTGVDENANSGNNSNDNASGTEGMIIFKVKVRDHFPRLHVVATTSVEQATSNDEADIASTTNDNVTSTTFRVRGGGLLNIIFDNPSGDESSTLAIPTDIIKKGKNDRGHNKQND